MTKERLLEAISAFDPDGKGLERVKDAADKNQLICGAPGHCLLAVAWQKAGEIIWVRRWTVTRGVADEFGFIVESEAEEGHSFNDVINWFDELGNEKSNKAVRELLHD